MKKFLKKVAVGFGILAGVFALFVTEENLRGKIALHDYVRHLRAQGEKLTFAELGLTNQSLPTKELSEFIAAGNELEILKRECPFTVEGQTGMRLIGYRRPLVRHQQPDLGVPWSRQGIWLTPRPTWDDLAAEVGKASNALTRIKAISLQPLSSAGITYSWWETREDYAHMTATRAAGNWLAVEVLNDLRRGDFDGTTDDIAALIALTRFWRDEPLFNSQFQRMRVAQLALDRTWEALQANGWNEAQLGRLQSAWETCDFADNGVDSLVGERAFRLGCFDQIRRSPKRFWQFWRGEIMNGRCEDEYSIDQLWFDARMTGRILLWRLAGLDRDELEFLKEWQEAIEQARTALRVGDRRQFHLDEYGAPHRGYANPSFIYLLSPAFEPSARLMVIQPMHAETERRMTLIAIALKRYALRHGTLPDSLHELTPTFLRDEPMDLMNGQRMHYRRNADETFTLYSVGENGIDDGGSTGRDSGHIATGVMWFGCDAVWFSPATEEDIAAWKRRTSQPSEDRRGRLRSGE